jgi:dolichol-phosphate mannosyltransferase
VDQIQPLLSNHFNLTVEMPLKAVVRGFNFAVVPVTWTNRSYGTSKLSLTEMGSRYAFIVLYVWLEHHLSRGDYRRKDVPRTLGAQDAPELELVAGRR